MRFMNARVQFRSTEPRGADFATLYATEIGYRAYEYKEKKQGYFTWVLVEALRGGTANEKAKRRSPAS